MKNIKLFSRYDLLVLTVISAAAILLLIPHFFGNDSLTATVKVGNETVGTYNLNEIDEAFEEKLSCTPSVIIRVEKGRICVKDADCPDRLCVGCGWLDSNGDTAVCLPAKVTVSVKGEKDKNAPDVITY